MDTKPGVCNEDRHRGCGPVRLLAGTGGRTSGGRASCRNIDLQYVRNSAARLSEHTCESMFASWTKFRRLVGRDQYLKSDADKGINEIALVNFAGWCSASQGNQAGGTTSSKRTAVQIFHVLVLGLEIPTQSLFVKRALKRISRAHAATGTPRRVRRPVSWGMFLHGKISYPHEDMGVG